MEIELVNLEIIAGDEDKRCIEPITKKYRGRTFATHHQMDTFIEKLEDAFNVVLMPTFCEHYTEEEEEEEWNDVIRSKMKESEETGIPFDHLMGAYLGGVDVCY